MIILIAHLRRSSESIHSNFLILYPQGYSKLSVPIAKLIVITLTSFDPFPFQFTDVSSILKGLYDDPFEKSNNPKRF